MKLQGSNMKRQHNKGRDHIWWNNEHQAPHKRTKSKKNKREKKRKITSVFNKIQRKK